MTRLRQSHATVKRMRKTGKKERARETDKGRRGRYLDLAKHEEVVYIIMQVLLSCHVSIYPSSEPVKRSVLLAL